MSEGTSGAPAPKKKFGFKKAAWQTAAPKAENDDMFSHSKDFGAIVAEEARRKKEQREKAEAERKRKAEEERNRKKRKVSSEMDEDIKHGGSGASHRSRMSSKGRSKTPLSPTRETHVDSLARRYDSLAKSSSHKAAQADVIDLGDSEDEDDLPVLRSGGSPSPAERSIPMRPVQRAPSSEVEEAEDPVLAELRARAREREAAKAARTAPSTSFTGREDASRAPVAQLLLRSELPDTNPLMIKVRLDMTLEKAKKAWCQKQGFTPEKSREIFCTFKMRRIYNSTKVERLGLKNLGNGCVKMDGDETIYDEENMARPDVQMWTEELFKQYQRQEAEKAAAGRRAAEPPPVYRDPSPEPEPEPTVQIHLFLKAKDKKIWKIIVKPDTPISQLTNSYKNARDVPAEQPITLMADGERLKPMDVIGDYDIEDNDSIEVHFK
ncbi:hypothetical protein CC80DRAFT_494248 [Byssothecium circinans]|uniref:Ubiquitin-like domain-containing protein n=1 Tax=Byssothecium circinans TaxID=147558 RepID=A0A6A5TQL9_9PLEO|nr:hypothetical protein CC80DRAFT_494248 [Byssothecium circinans]